jgi:hypothetical protein
VAVKTGVPTVVDFTLKIATPEALDVPEAGEIVSVPGARLDASVTVLPATGLLPAFNKVTVMVAVLTPSARSEVGEAATVEVSASAGGIAVKVTLAVWLTVTLSVVSVAVNTGDPGVEEVTVKVTTPESLEVPEAAEIVSVPAARLDASVTVLPGTAALVASSKVTVMVAVVLPSASTELGAAATVEVSASAGVVAPGTTTLPVPSTKLLDEV